MNKLNPTSIARRRASNFIEPITSQPRKIKDSTPINLFMDENHAYHRVSDFNVSRNFNARLTTFNRAYKSTRNGK